MNWLYQISNQFLHKYILNSTGFDINTFLYVHLSIVLLISMISILCLRQMRGYKKGRFSVLVWRFFMGMFALSFLVAIIPWDYWFFMVYTG